MIAFILGAINRHPIRIATPLMAVALSALCFLWFATASCFAWALGKAATHPEVFVWISVSLRGFLVSVIALLLLVELAEPREQRR